jgi:hypothetical protein
METLELFKNFFFFTGSTLGIIAFVKSTFNPLLEENKEKWKKVLEIFDDDFFQSLEFLDQTKAVESEQMSRLWLFLDQVREKKDFLEFKFPNKKIFNKHVDELVLLIEEFDKEVTPPIWSKSYKTNDNDRYSLSNSYFHKMYDDHNQATSKYREHLFYASNMAVKMRMEFQALNAIANLNFIELPFKRRIVKNAKSKYENRIIDI